MTDELKRKVETKVLDMLLIASELCPDLNVPEIKYNIRGRSAGQCVYYPGRGVCVLRFNSKLLEENETRFIDFTVPHEVAHYVTYKACGKVLPHGPEWESFMQLFGIKYPEVTHSYKIDEDLALYPWVYRCDCREHFFSSRRHALAKSRRTYYCRNCKGKVKFLKKRGE